MRHPALPCCGLVCVGLVFIFLFSALWCSLYLAASSNRGRRYRGKYRGETNSSHLSLAGVVKDVIFHGNLFISGCWKYASSFSLRHIQISASHLGSQHAFFWQNAAFCAIVAFIPVQVPACCEQLCSLVQAEKLELLSPLL